MGKLHATRYVFHNSRVSTDQRASSSSAQVHYNGNDAHGLIKKTAVEDYKKRFTLSAGKLVVSD